MANYHLHTNAFSPTHNWVLQQVPLVGHVLQEAWQQQFYIFFKHLGSYKLNSKQKRVLDSL